MARLVTVGFETRHYLTEGVGSSHTGTFSTAQARTGSVSGSCSSGQSFTASTAAGTGGTVFARAYLFFTSFPTSAEWIVLSWGAANRSSIKVTSSGTLKLYGGAAAIGSASAALSTNTWYKVELRETIGVGAVDEAEGRLDGVTFASGTGLSLSDGFPPGSTVVGDPGAAAGVQMYADDWAVNDTSGSEQTSWPGDGKIVLLLPVSDGGNVGTDAWLAGAGATTNLWEAVNNTPPVGVVESSATNTSQIKCDTPSANRTYSPVTQTYTAAGVGASDTVKLTRAIVAHGEAVTTGTKAGSITCSSNPTDASSTAFNYGDDGGQATTFPTLWAVARGPTTYSPSVTKGTGATLAVVENTNTRNGDVCFLGLYVEYEPAAATGKALPFRRRTNLTTLLRR